MIAKDVMVIMSTPEQPDVKIRQLSYDCKIIISQTIFAFKVANNSSLIPLLNEIRWSHVLYRMALWNGYGQNVKVPKILGWNCNYSVLLQPPFSLPVSY